MKKQENQLDNQHDFTHHQTWLAGKSSIDFPTGTSIEFGDFPSQDELSGDDRGRSPRGAGGYASRAADAVERRIAEAVGPWGRGALITAGSEAAHTKPNAKSSKW